MYRYYKSYFCYYHEPNRNKKYLIVTTLHNEYKDEKTHLFMKRVLNYYKKGYGLKLYVSIFFLTSHH